jgi:hypothetical protein
MEKFNEIHSAYFINDGHQPTIMIYKLCTITELHFLLPSSSHKNQILLSQNYFVNFLLLDKDYINHTGHPGASTINTIKNCLLGNEFCNINEPYENLLKIIPNFPKAAFSFWKNKLKNDILIHNDQSSYYEYYCSIS